jgi:hypothetical protein
MSDIPLVVFELISTNRHTNKSSYILYLTREGAITYSGYKHGDWRYDADEGFWYAANQDSSYQIRPRPVIVTQDGDIRPLDAMRKGTHTASGRERKAPTLGSRVGTGCASLTIGIGLIVLGYGAVKAILAILMLAGVCIGAC